VAPNVGKQEHFLQQTNGLLNGLIVYNLVVMNYGGDGQAIPI